MRTDKSLDQPVSSLERLVFFSDAVFAIAITLLAIDIRIPNVEHDIGYGSTRAAFTLLVAFAGFGLVLSIVDTRRDAEL